MIYLVGGAARSGKSAIARKFLAERGIPYFCLDHLMMGFANGLPESGVDDEVIREIERLKAFSPNLQRECDVYGLQYFETATDLEQTVEIVVAFLNG